MNIPMEKVLMVVLGGLFGLWMLGKLPDKWVYAVVALAILLAIVVFIK